MAQETSSSGRITVIHRRLRDRPDTRYQHLKSSCVDLVGSIKDQRTLAEHFFLVFRCRRLEHGRARSFTRVCKTVRATRRGTQTCFVRYNGSVLRPRSPSRTATRVLCVFFGHHSYISRPFSSEIREIIISAVTTGGGIVNVSRMPRVHFSGFVTPENVSLGRRGRMVVSKLCCSFLFVGNSNCPDHIHTN